MLALLKCVQYETAQICSNTWPGGEGPAMLTQGEGTIMQRVTQEGESDNIRTLEAPPFGVILFLLFSLLAVDHHSLPRRLEAFPALCVR